MSEICRSHGAILEFRNAAQGLAGWTGCGRITRNPDWNRPILLARRSVKQVFAVSFRRRFDRAG
jgi:hypothetical protein